MTPIRGFKLVFTAIGVIYVLLASYMLVRGADVLLEFAVPESVVASPVLQDIFYFFYQLMAWTGVITVLLGQVTRERKLQRLTASVFCVANILTALRDLSTSDSQLGNHLYKGERTLVFVLISLTFAAAFGFLTIKGRGNPTGPG